MRAGVVLAVVAGCFDPTIPTGAPCEPDRASCPQDQVCTASAIGFTCELPGDLPGRPDATAAIADGQTQPDAPGGTDDAPPALDATPLHLEYTATVAECVNPLAPDPAACHAANGVGQLVLDASDTGTGAPWEGFVRFDLDDALAGRVVTAVHLRLIATDSSKANGPDTGSVWAVAPFTLGSLTGTTPAHLGPPLAGTQGSVTQLEAIQWPLPAAVALPGAPVYLGLATGSGDGVNYWNLDGPDPPVLIVDAL